MTDTSLVIGSKGVLIGRSLKSDFVISQGCVSRNHCEISFNFNNNNFFVRDFASTTGTFLLLNDEKALRNNLMFQIGQSEFMVEMEHQESSECQLHVIEGPACGEIIYVDKNGLTIGKLQENGFHSVDDSEMANFHAKVTYIDGAGFYLTKNNVLSRIW